MYNDYSLLVITRNNFTHVGYFEIAFVFPIFLARYAFIRTNRRAIATMFVRSYVCLSSETGVHCDHTVDVSGDLS